MKPYLFISTLFTILSFASCTSQTRNIETKAEKDTFVYAHTIPENKRTPAQQRTVRLLAQTVARYVVSENNQLRFTLSKEQFLKLGLDVHYYNLLLRNLKEVNDFGRKNHLNLDSLWQTSDYQKLKRNPHLY